MKTKKKIPKPAPKRVPKRKSRKARAVPLHYVVSAHRLRLDALEEDVKRLLDFRREVASNIERRLNSAQESLHNYAEGMRELMEKAEKEQANRQFPMWHRIKLKARTSDLLRALANFEGVMSEAQVKDALGHAFKETTAGLVHHGVVMIQGDHENSWNRFFALTPYGRYLAAQPAGAVNEGI